MTPADQSLVQQMIQQAIAVNAQANRFNITNTSRHQHTVNDSAPVSYNDLTPGNSVEGSITFAQAVVYKIGVNFNPTTISAHGNVIGPGSQRFITVGQAKIGPSFYLQPGTSTSVITGGAKENIIQSCTYFGSDGSAFHTLVDEGHIVDVTYGGTIYARATITGYSNQNLLFSVETLVSGWNINLSLTIS